MTGQRRLIRAAARQVKLSLGQRPNIVDGDRPGAGRLHVKVTDNNGCTTTADVTIGGATAIASLTGSDLGGINLMQSGVESQGSSDRVLKKRGLQGCGENGNAYDSIPLSPESGCAGGESGKSTCAGQGLRWR